MNNNLQNYFISIICFLVLPVLPLFLDAWGTSTATGLGKPSLRDLFLCAAVYPLIIGGFSLNKSLIMICVLVSVVFIYGYAIHTATGKVDFYGGYYLASVAIIVFFVIGLVERFKFHMNDENSFI